jgi:exopolysaccharide production protein ExoQ
MAYDSAQHTAPQLQRTRLPWFLFLFLAAVFCVQGELSYSTRAIDNYMPSEGQVSAGVNEGSPVHRIAVFSLGLFAIVSLARHQPERRLRSNGLLGWVLLGFATWAFVSLIWAEDFALTFRRLVEFGTFCLAAVAVARRLSFREVILWTCFSTTLFLVIGVSAEIVLGTFRPLASGYRFAGTVHPNVQGINCALLLLSGVAAADLEKHRRALFRACALLGIVFLYLTLSRTAFAAVLLAVASYYGAVSSRATKIAVAFALGISFCLLLLVLGNALLLNLKSAALLGRDASGGDSLDGRNVVWEECANYVVKRPITGYGFGGFWSPDHIDKISETVNWAVGAAHSAYLDCLLEVGLVGLAAYVLALIMGVWRAFHSYRLTRNPAFAFSGAVLLFCATDGLLESNVVTPSFLMFLCMAVLTRLALAPSPRSIEGFAIHAERTPVAPSTEILGV